MKAAIVIFLSTYFNCLAFSQAKENCECSAPTLGDLQQIFKLKNESQKVDLLKKSCYTWKELSSTKPKSTQELAKCLKTFKNLDGDYVDFYNYSFVTNSSVGGLKFSTHDKDLFMNIKKVVAGKDSTEEKFVYMGAEYFFVTGVNEGKLPFYTIMIYNK